MVRRKVKKKSAPAEPRWKYQADEEDHITTPRGLKKKRCAAETMAGRRCKQAAAKGSQFCPSHGGKVAKGDGGRSPDRRLYSASLDRFKDRFNRLAQGEDFDDLRPGLALMAIYSEHLVERAFENDTIEFRQRAMERWSRCLDAKEEGNMEDFDKRFQELGELLEIGVESDRNLAEAVNIAEKRQVRVERAVEIELKHEETMSVRAVMMLFGEIVKVIQRSIPKTQSQPILEEIREIAASGHRRDVPSGS